MIQPQSPQIARPRLGVALRRGLLGRCPNCGSGWLFSSYLKPVEGCAVCGEAYGHIRSDDAAPWLTILVVGHVAVPIILAVEGRTHWPTWVSLTAWLPFVFVLTLAFLPRAKGFLMAVLWFTRAPGSERD